MTHAHPRAGLLAVALVVGGPALLPAQQLARSPRGMVVAAHPLGTDAGVEILEAGGNAVDAAVAAAFALGVVDPEMSGLGGRTQILVRHADGRVAGIDGTTRVPLGYAGDAQGPLGYRAIGVPGTVAALTRALTEHGTMPLARVLAPAIRYAEEGVAVLPGTTPGAADGFDAEGSARAFFGPGGRPLAPGEALVQPDLAATLRTLATGGAAAFYGGPVARRMVDDVAGGGGSLALRDLAEYRAEDAIVARGRFRGRELVGTWLPASGATTIEALQILDRLGAPDGEAERVARTARALVRAFADREDDVGSPQRRAAWVTSDSLADRRAAEVRAGRWIATPARRGGPAEAGHTTHLSVADADGNVVALTQSLGDAAGARVVTGGLGFLYATTMGYLADPAPGGRPWSSQSPMIVVGADGQVELVLGASGARRIIGALVRTVEGVLDRDEPLPAAVAAPRIHADTAEIYLELDGEGRRRDLVPLLEAAGWTVAARPGGRYFALVHALGWDRDRGEWVGVADPRGYGAARGPGGGR